MINALKLIDETIDMPRKKKRSEESLPFGKILKALMDERNLTLRQVSELAGVSVSVVQGWLQGANPNDLQAVSGLAKKLGVSFKSLLLGKDETINKAGSIAELYEKQEVFEGLCEISIKRLIPRNK